MKCDFAAWALQKSTASNETPRFIAFGYDANPALSKSLRAEAYTERYWFDADLRAVISKSWQWVCHVEKTRDPGAFVPAEIAGQPIAAVRDKEGTLRAFYNVCKHRAHEFLAGEGRTTRIMCPYHAWATSWTGSWPGPRGHRLTYDIKSNWKNVVDNFLACCHCPTAHKDFCDLVDMDTYKVTTCGIYSSHMADAGQNANSAYDVSNATVKTHAVWWLYPTACLMRYPGRSSMIVLNIIPVGADRTLETYDFFLETPAPDATELDAIRYLDEVLQVEDINLVENVQRGMGTPAFTQGRIVHDPDGSGKSEHAVHHFHGRLLDAYAKGAV